MEVDDVSVLVQTHGVYREVSSFKILFQIAREGHILGMTVVEIVRFTAVGSYVYLVSPYKHRNGAVFLADVVAGIFIEHHPYRFRRGVGCNVVVAVDFAQKKIPDRTAYEICFVSFVVQFLKSRIYRFIGFSHTFII